MALVYTKEAFEYAVREHGFRGEYSDFYSIFKNQGQIEASSSGIRGRWDQSLLKTEYVDDYFKAMVSPLRLLQVVAASKVEYFTLYRVAHKNHIPLVKKYGQLFFETEEGKNNAIRISQQSRKYDKKQQRVRKDWLHSS